MKNGENGLAPRLQGVHQTGSTPDSKSRMASSSGPSTSLSPVTRTSRRFTWTRFPEPSSAWKPRRPKTRRRRRPRRKRKRSNCPSAATSPTAASASGSSGHATAALGTDAPCQHRWIGPDESLLGLLAHKLLHPVARRIRDIHRTIARHRDVVAKEELSRLRAERAESVEHAPLGVQLHCAWPI